MDLLGSLVQVFAGTVLPVLLVAGAGFVLARAVQLDGRTLGRVVFFLASPALVLRSLYNLDLDTALLQQELLLVAGVYLLTGVAGWIAGTGLERPQRTALTLSSAISNNGNIGLPVAFFALGDAGLAAATVYYTISALLTNTFGVFVASAGTAPLRQALSQSLRAPVLYATLVGLLCNRLSVPIPDSLYRAIDLLAGATIPIMLVLLGIQLSQTTLTRAQTVVWRSLLIRLGLSPAIALALCLWIGIGGVERQVMVLQAAMPTAVVATVLSTEFAAAPRLVAAAVLASTLVSVVTVSILLAAIT